MSERREGHLPSLAGASPPNTASQRLTLGPPFPPPYRSSLTGQAYRHGPALMAAALQDRELPAVSAVFDAYSAAPFTSSPPPLGHVALEQQVRLGLL